MRLFTRKPVTPEETLEVESSEVGDRPRSFTPAKGKATPKRTDGRRKAAPPPSNRREAVARLREKQKVERAEQLAGLKAGDDRYLTARDRGPERALIRDFVDSRRNAGTWFFGAAFIVIFTLYVQPLQVYGQLLWFFLLILLVVDSIIMSRKIKKMIRERFPKTTQRMGGLYFYGIMRGITFRRMRIPQPRVKVGDKI